MCLENDRSDHATAIGIVRKIIQALKTSGKLLGKLLFIIKLLKSFIVFNFSSFIILDIHNIGAPKYFKESGPKCNAPLAPVVYSALGIMPLDF